MTATGLACSSCGIELPQNAKFCLECGAPVTEQDTHAEYKQVTVLFADVVHSMDIAAAVGAERLREIMTDLIDRASAVVQRYGGTVDKFTGDGIMAVFGAPVALEDHAIRACLAALGIQDENTRLAAEVKDRDEIDLQLRVGLNSGEVIAGEIGSGPFGYTAVGEQVGMAQRMEAQPVRNVELMQRSDLGRLLRRDHEHWIAFGDVGEVAQARVRLNSEVVAGDVGRRPGKSPMAGVGQQHRWPLSRQHFDQTYGCAFASAQDRLACRGTHVSDPLGFAAQ